MTTPTVETTRILASRLEDAKAAIEKANRKLAKAGIAERFTLTVGERYEKEYRHEFTGFRYTIAYRDVTLNTPALGYQGWTFVATLSFEEGGTVVRNVPGQVCDYRPTTKVCDQCHTDRYRTETFVVRNDETGEYKQVGRNCLALFFGLKPALWVFDYSIASFSEGEDDSEYLGGGYGRGDRRMSTLDIVAAALAVSNMGRGYVSAQAEWKESTKAQVLALFYERPHPRDHERNAWLRDKGVLAAQFKQDGTAESVINFVKDLKGGSEYATNARILANSEYVDPKNLGLVASFAKVWANEQERAAERKAEEASQPQRINDYYARVGEKIVVEGVVTMVREFDGSYGTTTMIKWLSPEGYTFAWFASGVKDIETGDKVRFQGTVKKHDEYKGYKSTVLTRCKAV